MDLSRKKLDDLISAVEKIVEVNNQQESNLFNEITEPADIAFRSTDTRPEQIV